MYVTKLGEFGFSCVYFGQVGSDARPIQLIALGIIMLTYHDA